jgi:hypothetical protein
MFLFMYKGLIKYTSYFGLPKKKVLAFFAIFSLTLTFTHD